MTGNADSAPPAFCLAQKEVDHGAYLFTCLLPKGHTGDHRDDYEWDDDDT